jgi:methylenetetrahydrofolate--tRNA-(uracil-5-)-methyltransferase
MNDQHPHYRTSKKDVASSMPPPKSTENSLIVIGGGLAGCEAAWQAANRQIQVTLYEMRPATMTGAHQTEKLAELICSNSLGSKLPDRATGLLQEEIQRMGSLILACAHQTQVPAGGALAVDREAFADLVTQNIQSHPNIEIIREEVTELPKGVCIIASGPLTSPALASQIQNLLDDEGMAFFDAIAPIVASESINMQIAFRGSRYQRGELQQGDYINCPFTEKQYHHFVHELINAHRIPLKTFETAIKEGVKAGMHTFFEGCLPIEIMAERGNQSLAFGPMRPIGIFNPHTNHRPYAVVQLRQDDLAGSLYNLVGFQTNLTYSEQKRIFRLIPGLENAEFHRYGQMHRNTFIASPKFLTPTLQLRDNQEIFFAGQITGVEGYIGNAATGLLAGVNAAHLVLNQQAYDLPADTMLGALMNYITTAPLDTFQPMKANFGIMPPLPDEVKGKRNRAAAYAERAKHSLENYLSSVDNRTK